MRHCIRLVAITVLCAMPGCSPTNGPFNVTGRVVKGGVPLTVPDDEYVRVTFFPVTADGGAPKNTYAAAYNRQDGGFRATGGDGKGIPPGKYRVAVEHEKNRRDVLKGAYDGDRTPFEFEIDRKTRAIVLDLDQK